MSNAVIRVFCVFVCGLYNMHRHTYMYNTVPLRACEEGLCLQKLPYSIPEHACIFYMCEAYYAFAYMYDYVRTSHKMYFCIRMHMHVQLLVHPMNICSAYI